MSSMLSMLSSSERLRRTVEGKKVVITGASDGIGAHLASRLAAVGAHVILLARTEEKLRAVGDNIREAGGHATEVLADLSKEEDCKRALAEVVERFGAVDVVISNAGRSIRRSVKYQGGDRFHDFQRLMALNFFGGLRVILGFLPGMMEQKSGHIIHISSFGVPTRQPRFAGYSASKAAMDAALQSAAGEVEHCGVHTSTVYMPLVQTKMVQSKGHSYDHISMLPMDLACELIEHALMSKDRDVMDAPSRFLALLYFFRPHFIVSLNALVYGLETEHAPEGVGRLESRKDMEKKQKRISKKGWSPLKALGRVLWFFSRLELFCLRHGVPIMVRDPIIMVFLVLFLVIQPIVVLVMWLVRGGRKLYTSARGSEELVVTECSRSQSLTQPGQPRLAEAQAEAEMAERTTALLKADHQRSSGCSGRSGAEVPPEAPEKCEDVSGVERTTKGELCEPSELSEPSEPSELSELSEPRADGADGVADRVADVIAAAAGIDIDEKDSSPARCSTGSEDVASTSHPKSDLE